MMSTLWRNENYNTFVDSMYVYNIKPDIGFRMFNPHIHNKTSIKKPYKTTVVDIVNLFFPKKKRDDIIKELKDKQLLLKLYKCFPDY